MLVSTQRNELVSNVNGELLVSSITISENLDILHDSILSSITKYEKELKEFGELIEQDFKESLNISNNKSLLKQRKAYLLNENQSMLLINLSRNTKQVVTFKVALTKAFLLMKEQLSYKDPIDLIINSAKQMKEIKFVQDKHSETLDYLVNKAPIVYNQIKYLEDLRKKKTFSLVGYENKDNYSKTIRKLTKLFKDKFQIARYADLPKDKYNDAIKWVNDIQLVDLI